MSRRDVVKEARTYVGTPYQHQGRVKGAGVDCIGVVVGVMKTLLNFQEDFFDYAKKPDGKTLEREVNKHLRRIDPVNAKEGDVLMFWIRRRGIPQHVGIISDHGLIHSNSDFGGVVEHVLEDRWTSRIHAAFQIPGVVE